MDVEYLKQKLSERERHLAAIDAKVAALSAERFTVETEARVYREIIKDFTINAPEARTVDAQTDTPTNDVRSNLSLTWTNVFREVLSAWPNGLTMDEMKAVGRRFGDVGESFRTSAWHHVKKGSLQKSPSGTYRATERTAKAIGEPWPGLDFGGDNASNEIEAATA